MNKGRLLTLIILFAGIFSASQAQPFSNGPWQYETYPELPFTLENIDMEISVDPAGPLVKGSADYVISSRRPDLTAIVFNTSELDIRGITFGEQSADYHISNDSLMIQLPDTLAEGEEVEFAIAWESSSPYGIHADVYGNTWTSLNPQMRNHWLPIPDHPEVESTFQVKITAPADKEVVFNGTKLGDEVISTDQHEVRWHTEEPIPVSGVSFALGNFVQESARSGVNEVSLWTIKNGLMEEVKSGLLEIAVQSLKDYERTLGFEFPYENLHVVVLPDHRWEEIQAGAGILYLYQNAGSLGTQLRRGIAAQWFGNYHRYVNPLDERYEFLRSLVAGSPQNELLASDTGLESIAQWNRWEKVSGALESEFQEQTIRSSLPEILQRFEGVTSWEEYAGYWYDETGAFWQQVAKGELPSSSAKNQETVYHIEYLYDEMNGELSLAFEAQGDPVTTLVTAEATEYGFMDTTRSELSFTGAMDTVQVDISSGIEYLTVHITSDHQVVLKEEKPFMFLVRQLQNPQPEVQIQAAEQLRTFTDNPDVQLAIRDVLREEDHAEVRAAMLETLAALTKGATGTEETFLGSLNSENQALKLSSIRSLANYPENDRVKNSLRNTVLRSEQDTVFTTALKAYQQIASVEDLRAVAERLDQSNSYFKAVEALKLAIAEDSTRQSISMADRYALGSYPYEVREQALALLMQYETNESYWEQTLELLLEDRDPRIRFQSLNAIQHLSSGDTVEVIRARLTEEMDPRVRAKIRRIL